MIVAIDVQYTDDTEALAAAVVFNDWADAHPVDTHTAVISPVEPYVPGQFWRRELPCIMEVLKEIWHPIDCVIVDGHVWLGPGVGGLGYYVYEALERRIPVVGVAKRHFRDGCAVEVLRGESRNPLYVTAVGTDTSGAAHYIQRMHGPYRIPTLLKRVDALCRGRSA